MVYIVTSGEYSDYGIRAVFSTKELAEKFLAWKQSTNDWDEFRIETYDLDDESFLKIAKDSIN